MHLCNYILFSKYQAVKQLLVIILRTLQDVHHNDSESMTLFILEKDLAHFAKFYLKMVFINDGQ